MMTLVWCCAIFLRFVGEQHVESSMTTTECLISYFKFQSEYGNPCCPAMLWWDQKSNFTESMSSWYRRGSDMNWWDISEPAWPGINIAGGVGNLSEVITGDREPLLSSRSLSSLGGFLIAGLTGDWMFLSSSNDDGSFPVTKELPCPESPLLSDSGVEKLDMLLILREVREMAWLESCCWSGCWRVDGRTGVKAAFIPETPSWGFICRRRDALSNKTR